MDLQPWRISMTPTNWATQPGPGEPQTLHHTLPHDDLVQFHTLKLPQNYHCIWFVYITVNLKN